MSPPPKSRKAPPAKGKKGRGKKKMKPSPIAGQLVAGLTLAAMFVGVAGIGVYLAPRFMPKAAPSATPKPDEVVVRPSIEPKLDSMTLKRPGLALEPPDEVYFNKAADIKANNPLAPAVNNLLGKGVITVFADGLFRPNDPIPRAEFLVWLYNADMEQTTPGPDPFITVKKPFPTVQATGDEFPDVPVDYWAANVLASIKRTNVFMQVLDKKLRPDAPLTREEWLGFAAYLGTAKDVQAKLPDQANMTKVAVAMRKLNYNDPQALKDEYRLPMLLVAGDDKRRAWIADTFPPPVNIEPFAPNKPVTRGQAAAWMNEAYSSIGLGIM